MKIAITIDGVIYKMRVVYDDMAGLILAKELDDALFAKTEVALRPSIISNINISAQWVTANPDPKKDLERVIMMEHPMHRGAIFDMLDPSGEVWSDEEREELSK